jgi:hypothetical protein
MAQNFGDGAISTPNKTSLDQPPPTTGFQAELQSMTPSQLSCKADAQTKECPSLPGLQLHDSSAAASSSPDAAQSSDKAQNPGSTKPDQNALGDVNSQNSNLKALDPPQSAATGDVNSPNSNLKALDPPQSAVTGDVNSQNSNLKALDPPQSAATGDVNSQNSNLKALDPPQSAANGVPTEVPQTNATAIKPFDNSAVPPIQSAYENLDLDVRQPQNATAPDENQNQQPLLDRIKNIAATQSAASAPAAAPPN